MLVWSRRSSELSDGVINGVIRRTAPYRSPCSSLRLTGVVYYSPECRNSLTDSAIIRVDIPVIPPKRLLFVLVLISFILAFFLTSAPSWALRIQNRPVRWPLYCGLYGQRRHCRFGRFCFWILCERVDIAQVPGYEISYCLCSHASSPAARWTTGLRRCCTRCPLLSPGIC